MNIKIKKKFDVATLKFILRKKCQKMSPLFYKEITIDKGITDFKVVKLIDEVAIFASAKKDKTP